jgi:hypothetical protein
MKIKPPQTAYGIVDPSGTLLLSTLSEWRKYCIENFCRDMGYNINEWKQWKKGGWRVVKFDTSKIKEVK